MKKINRVLSVVLCVLLMVSMLATCQFSFAFAATEGDYTYTVAANETATVTGYDGTDAIVVIPDTLGGYMVTAIADKAFADCKKINEITVPDTVTAIGAGAFQDCVVLSKIVLPATLATVGDAAFANCGALRNLDLGTAAVGIGIISGCSTLESLTIASVGAADNGVGYMATLFNGVTDPADPKFAATLKTITVTADSSVDAYAFAGMENLEVVNWTADVTTLGDSAFAGCTSLKEANMNIRAEEIGANAFNGCALLDNIALTDAVVKVGEGAFAGCSALLNITAHTNLNEIGAGAFKGTKWLATQPEGEVLLADVLCAYKGDVEKLTVSGAVRSIADGALEGISAKEVVIPNTVAFIGAGILKDTNVTTVTIPYLGESADGSSTYISYLFGGSSFAANALILPKTLTKVVLTTTSVVPKNAFTGCAYLTTVVVPATVTEIKESAFANCAKLTTIEYNAATATVAADVFSGSSISTLKLGDTVKVIPTHLATGNINLKEITIAAGVEKIEARAFAGCYNLETVVFEAVNCTEIAKDAFNYCHRLSTISLSDGVGYIPTNLFSRYGGANMTTLTIPESVTEIAAGAFENCVSLTTLNYNATACVIGDDAFTKCAQLKNINLGENVTAIPTNLYSGNQNIEKIEIPQQINRIDRNAFVNCSALAEIVANDALTSIGTNAFAGTKWIDMQANGPVYLGNIFYTYKGSLPVDGSVTIKDGTVAIADGALAGNNALTNIFIPNSVTEFGENIFTAPAVTITCYATATAAIKYAEDNGVALNKINCDDQDIYYVIVEQATADAEGTLQKICLTCGQEIGSENYALSDDLSDKWVLTTAPTCTDAGELTKGADTKPIAATGHQHTIWKETTIPTCADFGVAQEICLDCNTALPGEKLTEKKAHTPGEWQVLRQPRTYCTGYDAILCTECGIILRDATVAKLEMGNPMEAIQDVTEDAWYHDTVAFVLANGLFNGVDKNNFAPNTTMNRGMFVTVLGRLAGVQVSNDVTTPFKDVAANQYYTGYVQWAAQNKIVNGITETEFAPNAAITREQICTMIVRYCNVADIELTAKADAPLFRDADEISSYAFESVMLCQKAGLIQGRSDRYFAPRDTATRAEVAQILMNLCQGYLAID